VRRITRTVVAVGRGCATFAGVAAASSRDVLGEQSIDRSCRRRAATSAKSSSSSLLRDDDEQHQRTGDDHDLTCVGTGDDGRRLLRSQQPTPRGGGAHRLVRAGAWADTWRSSPQEGGSR
jgi:hypothetical protein